MVKILGFFESLSARVGWRLFPSLYLKALGKFSATETDSAWQIQHTLRSTNDHKLQAKLFEHSLEELEHGEAFAKLLKKEGPSIVNIPHFERKPLVRGSLEEKLESLEAGEIYAYQKFKLIEQGVGPKDFSQLVQRVLEEEEGHASQEKKFSPLNSKAARAHFGKILRTLGYPLTYILSALILLPIYIFIYPLFKIFLGMKK